MFVDSEVLPYDETPPESVRAMAEFVGDWVRSNPVVHGPVDLQDNARGRGTVAPDPDDSI